MKIFSVAKNSIADELGIKAGDELLAFDGFPVTDVLDYDYYDSLENFVMTVRSGGEVTDYEIEKYDDEELGLELDREIRVRSCRNNCIFCFVDQLPKEELRSTLRVKDDDYRHSFIFGNYVTLTNVTGRELERIIRIKLSPLYVSVHSSDYAMRNKLLGINHAPAIPDIVTQLRKLHAGGIRVHAQIVYCPDVNEDVEQTIRDISPYTESLAIVPVGLTRDCNPELRRVDCEHARRILDIVDKWQRKLLAERGTRYVFASDELYLAAEREIPPYEAYEDFCQIENGIGLIAAFVHDFENALADCASGHVGEMSIATGLSAKPLIERCAQKLTAKFGGKIHVYGIRNDFFGESVTVAGLVVGRDIAAQIGGKPLGERLVLPRIMLREFQSVFLDGYTVERLESELKVKVQIIQPDGESFVREITGNEESV